jgi:hypothetical protein
MAVRKQRQALPWTLEEKSRNVHVIRLPVSGPKWEQWVLLSSDHHLDNPHCRQDLLKEHLREARDRNACAFAFGDSFCAMQGKYDKRANKDDLRPEHKVGDYLDALVRTAADFYQPYSDRLLMMSQGNHETSILKNCESDLLERLCERLRMRGGTTRAGGFSGWVRFQFARGNAHSSLRLFYHHGYGGGGPVTKGLIDYNRMGTFADADVIVSGHTHDKMHVPGMRVSLNDGNVVEQREQHFVRCGSYKDEYGAGEGGFHIEKGRPPKPLGAYWMRLFLKNDRPRAEFTSTTN